MKHMLVSALVLLPLATHAWAYLQQYNTRLDHAIYPKHAPKLIIGGTIDAIHRNVSMMDPKVAFSFSVHDVILGEDKYKGQLLCIEASSLVWPDDLAPFKEATRCILVLGRRLGEQRDKLYIAAVVPASGKRLPLARNGEEAKSILEGEILAELGTETRPDRQRALLLQVAPILTKEHAREVVPFVKSANVWVRRAALSALIYATEEEQYVKQMALDVQGFFTTTKSSDPIRDRYARYPYHFFDHYFFLEQRSWTWGSRWNEDEAKKHLRILNAMFSTGIISNEVKKTLNPEQETTPNKR